MNHASDTPDECCPVCFGDGSIDVDDLPKLRAMAARDADVRTLDDWCAQDPTARSWTVGCENEHGIFGLALHDGRAPILAGTGSTPDEARAKAAAWVREQGRERCLTAFNHTDGNYQCTRENGHDGPCAAVPSARGAV